MFLCFQRKTDKFPYFCDKLIHLFKIWVKCFQPLGPLKPPSKSPRLAMFLVYLPFSGTILYLTLFLMQVFHWSRQASNCIFGESGPMFTWLGSVASSRSVRENQ